MSQSTLERFAMTECFLDVQEEINKTVYSFARKYGGDVDELKADANYFYSTYAFPRYERRYGPFAKWVRYVVYKQLLEQVRKKAYRYHRMRREPIELDSQADKEQFHLVELIDGLSDDAKTVVNFVLGSPRDLQVALIGCGKKELSPYTIRNALRGVLRDLGWSHAKVMTTFREIQGALS